MPSRSGTSAGSTAPATHGRIDKRRAIMAAATDVFLSDGFSRTRIESVADKAGVSKQTVYNHMRDKETLFLAVVEEALHKADTVTLEALDAFPDHPQRLEEDLVAFGHTLARSFLDDTVSALRRVLTSEVGRYPHLVEAWRARGPGLINRALADRLARLSNSGHLSVDDADLAARHFMALVTYEPELHSALGTVEVPEATLDAAVRGAVRTFLRAFGAVG